MLDVTRIDSDNLPLRLAPCDLANLVREVLGRLEVQLENSLGPVRVHAHVPVTASVGRYRIEQVMTNLLTNAARVFLSASSAPRSPS